MKCRDDVAAVSSDWIRFDTVPVSLCLRMPVPTVPKTKRIVELHSAKFDFVCGRRFSECQPFRRAFHDAVPRCSGWSDGTCTAHCLARKKSCKRMAFDLVELVNQKKGDKDNASVILIRVGEMT